MSHRRIGLGSPRRIKVLRYHRIVEGRCRSSRDWPCMQAEHFRHHLDSLTQWGFTPITFHDYRLFLKGELNLPSKPVILTFDLAYRDNHKYMFPVMQKIGAKGVVFASGDRHARESSWLVQEGFATAPLMSDHELIEMHEAGFEIGSHGMSYANLARVPRDQAAEDISRSRILLEILLNSPVLTFSYPFGTSTAETRQLVSEAGYTIGCAMDSGSRTFMSDPWNVRRASMKEPLSGVMLRTRLFFA